MGETEGEGFEPSKSMHTLNGFEITAEPSAALPGAGASRGLRAP
jgi:hypothetical protein